MSVAGFSGHAAVADRSRRGKLLATGEQAEWFLGQLVTNHVEECVPGGGMEALLLTPKGRIVHHMRIVAAARGRLWIDLEPGGGSPLHEFLAGRVFATKVELADVTGDFTILRVLGPDADSVVKEVLEGLPGFPGALPGDDEHAAVFEGDAGLVRVRRPIWGLDVWAPSAMKASLLRSLEAAGAPLASEEDYETLRVANGLPEIGADFDGRHLPQEAALERAVHFKKGCYLGQEAVAMAQRGKVKRRLRHLHFEGTPARGEVFFQGEPAGEVTSIAVMGGRAFGIGTVKTAAAPGEHVEVGEARVPAAVGELPGTVEGPALPSARELRERLEGLPPRPARA